MIICLKFGKIEAVSLHTDTEGLFKNYHSSCSLTPDYCLTMLIILKSHPLSWVCFSFSLNSHLDFIILEIKFHPYQPGTMSLYPMSKQPRSKHYLPGLLQINPDSSYPQT